MMTAWRGSGMCGHEPDGIHDYRTWVKWAACICALVWCIMKAVIGAVGVWTGLVGAGSSSAIKVVKFWTGPDRMRSRRWGIKVMPWLISLVHKFSGILAAAGSMTSE